MIPHSMLNLLISNFPPHKLKTCSCTWYMFTKRKHHEAVSQPATSSDSNHLMCSTKKIDPPSYMWHNKVIWCQTNQFCNLFSWIEPWGDCGALPTVLQTTSHDKLKCKWGMPPISTCLSLTCFSVLPLQSSSRGYLFLHEAVATMSWSYLEVTLQRYTPWVHFRVQLQGWTRCQGGQRWCTANSIF